MRKITLSLLTAFLSLYAAAQQHYDHITPLGSNPVLVQLAKQKANEKIGPPPPVIIKVLSLPFLDDFSKPSPYPDTALWLSGGGVYTNYTYPTCPHTLGVATFDGVNAYGLPYDPGASPYASNPADTLASQYIGLADYAPIDSLYLSFYWQSGGLGLHPKTNDTLVLEFSNGTTWHRVWYQLGYIPPKSDSGFHYVMVPITDPQYFVNAFQFRFRSYSCGAGNLDHWNLDEVYINRIPRTISDTFQHDVSFVYESPSLIANYRAMPWEQFTSGDVKSNVFIHERNNDTGIVNMRYYDTIYGPTVAQNSGHNGGNDNMTPYYTNGYWTGNSNQSDPPLNFKYLALSGPATWTINYVMNTPGDFDNWNDTLRYNQTFSNYYAYDDGTAEANYSLINYNSPTVQLACQFKLNNPDTLLGVSMFFNYVLANAGSYTFRLAYWTDNGGQPGSSPVVEDSAIYAPKYDSLDQFVYYKFAHPPTVSGTIYVGFIETAGDSINIGYDWNDDAQNQTFYNVNDGNGWYYSTYKGSPMLRPVFGNTIYNAVNEVKNNVAAIQLYPNPARDEVQLSEQLRPNTTVKLYGSDGRLWYENEHFEGKTLSTSALPNGFYIMQVQPKGQQAQYLKLLISR